MWITPTWSQAIDAISRALGIADENKKKISQTHSLQGKRDRESASCQEITKFIAGENLKLNQVVRIALDVMHIALRELHTQPLVTLCNSDTCQQRFFFCWIFPLLESMQQRASQIHPQERFLTDTFTMLQDYYYDESQATPMQSVDTYLNKRITQLLPHGQCKHFKQQLHKHKNRRFFSLSDKNHRVVLQEIKQDLTSSGLSVSEVADRVDNLRRVFISGAILREVEKRIGRFDPQHRLSNEQRQVIATCHSQNVESLVLMPQKFLTVFAPAVDIWLGSIQQQRLSSPNTPYHFIQVTQEEWELFWPELMQFGVDEILRNCEDNCYLPDVFDFCVKFAPDWVRASFTSTEIDELINQCDVHNTASLDTYTPRIEKAIFNEVKKIVVAMHQRQQLGMCGIRLASMLIANALTYGYRVTQHELTPLMNILIENLPADNRLFPLNEFVTPFGLREIANLGNPLVEGESVDKDDEAMIYALALRKYNHDLFTLFAGEKNPVSLGYPFQKLDSILRDIFKVTLDIKHINGKTVATLFRKAGVRLTAEGKGNPCWRLSDATPYIILRNLEMFLPLLGLEYEGKVWLQPGLDTYYCLSNDNKKRVLQAIDSQAYQRDQDICQAAERARQQNEYSYKVNGERFMRIPRRLLGK